MRRIDIFVSSPGDVQKERSMVERTMRAVAREFGVPVTVSYSDWRRKPGLDDKAAAESATGSKNDGTWLCPCFWEYQNGDPEQNNRDEIPNTGAYDLVISILWSRLGNKLSPAFVMPDGRQPKCANDYEVAWVLDQLKRSPGFPELLVYRNELTPPAPLQPVQERKAFLNEWDAVQQFFTTWEKEEAFRAACSAYQDLQTFEILFREHFSGFLKRQLEKHIVSAEPPSQVPGPQPYRGLQLFDFEHSSIYHGRTRAVGEGLDVLNKQTVANNPFLLVIGAGGSGKSSFVRAGLLALLAETGTKGPWRRAITRPGLGNDPFESLALALLANEALPELRNSNAHDGWRGIAAELKENPEAVAERISRLIDEISARELDRLKDQETDQLPASGRIQNNELARHRKLQRTSPKAHLALFIDQLEDLFGAGFAPELRQQYIATISILVRTQKISVVAALRSDFYASYQQFPELVALTLPSGRFDLQMPDREELGRIIRWPATASGLRFERDLKSGQALDDALVEAAASSTDPLPLLEHLLATLYQKQADRKDGLLRWSDYRDAGEFNGALPKHAETAFTALSSDAQRSFEFVMRRLVFIESDDKASCRRALYHDLISFNDLDARLRAGAKELIESMVKEGLFTEETDPKGEKIVGLANVALLEKWPRVQEWLTENREFLRIRDRVDACLKLWTKRGRQTRDLLGPGANLADGKTLLSHFHSSLSDAQVKYIQQSDSEQKRGRRVKYLIGVPVIVGLASLAALFGVHWFDQQYSEFEKRLTALTQVDRTIDQAGIKQAEERAKLAEESADVAAAQLNTLESQLQKAQEQAQSAQRNADLAQAQRTDLELQLKQIRDKAPQGPPIAPAQMQALEAQVKKAEEKAQLSQQNAELASSQRANLEAQLKQAQDQLQQAQQNSELAQTQRTALEGQLKQAQEKLQLAQQNGEQALNQRTALETQLKQAQEKLQQFQQRGELALSQRVGLEAQLGQAQDKLRQAQQNGELAVTQRAALEAQLKQAQDKLQQIQQGGELALNQRDASASELRDAKDKLLQAQQDAVVAQRQRAALADQVKQAQDALQQAQQDAKVALTQRAALEDQLKQVQDKLQQNQKGSELASSQRAALEDQLKQAQQSGDLAQKRLATLADQAKQAQDALQQAQQGTKLALTQRSALEDQLKQAQDALQQAQQDGKLALNQRAALEDQLKKAQDKAQLAQQTGEAALKQRAALEDQLRQAQDKLQQAQQNSEVALNQRADLEAKLVRAEEKAQLAEKISDLVAGRSPAVANKPPVQEVSRNNANSAGPVKAGRALPLDAGQTAVPGTSTQPLISSGVPATH